jgi:tetratricopeptide (TPR) repeat protein
LLNLLYCYAPEDQSWTERIDAHLQELKRQCHVMSRFDGELTPNPTQKVHLLALFDNMDVILLLVSAHFQAVESFWREICQESWAVRWLGGCRVVALVLEPVAWTHAPAGAREILPREGMPPRAEQERELAAPLEVFPSDVKPLAAWPSQEQAFEQIEQWMHVTFEKQWLARGDLLNYEGGPQKKTEALAAYEEALRLNPALRDAWYGKAHMLVELKRYEEALHASDEALRLAPDYLWAWYTRANALAGLKRYEEALQAYDEVLRRDATRSWAWRQKSTMLIALGRKRAAHQAQKIARQLGWRR